MQQLAARYTEFLKLFKSGQFAAEDRPLSRLESLESAAAVVSHFGASVISVLPLRTCDFVTCSAHAGTSCTCPRLVF